MKTLWIVSGGLEAVPGIQHAREMGFKIVVSDGNPDAPGFKYSDYQIVASTYDSEATVKAALQFSSQVSPIDGVISVASDVPMTVAKVAEALNLPGISVQTAQLSSDKFLMKKHFVEHGIPIPRFGFVESASHLKKIMSEKDFPLIIKPVDSRGARGVLKLSDSVDLDWAYDYSRSYSPSKKVMVEEFLSGPQISTESVMLNGKGFTSGFSDRNYEYLEKFSPFVVENGGQMPSVLSEIEQKQVSALAEKAAFVMGIVNGTAKGDLVLTSAGPKVIEMAARLSGGWFSTDQIPYATGVDLMGAAFKFALNEPVDEVELSPEFQKALAVRYFFPNPGVLKSVRCQQDYRDCEWLLRSGFFVSPGEKIEPVSDHTKRFGFVIATGEDASQAINRAQKFIDSHEIEIGACN